jgi:hypothetical protein
VFAGKVYGVTFGASSDELWVLVATRGWAVPYPAIRHAVFTPFAADVNDDEREEGRHRR